MRKILKSTRRWRTAAALTLSAAVLAACGGGASDVVGEEGGNSDAETTLTLVAFAVPEPGWSKVSPAFAATEEGKGVAVTGSYGASGDQSRAVESGKPADIVARMVEGRVNKFLAEVTLLGQPFVKNPDETVEKVLKAKGASVKAFAMYVVGEGIERRKDDFAAEVAAMAKA